MNKYNIKIVVPILNKSYEVIVPNNILVGNLLYMFVNSLKELNNIELNYSIFYDSINGEEINLDEYIFKYLKNGSSIILI